MLWQLKTTKTIFAEVKTKENTALILHEQMLSFFTIRQRETDTDNDYPTWFSKILQNMEMSTGEHVVYSTQLLGKDLKSGTLEKSLLKWIISNKYVSYEVDVNWHGKMLEDLKNDSVLDSYEEQEF